MVEDRRHPVGDKMKKDVGIKELELFKKDLPKPDFGLLDIKGQYPYKGRGKRDSLVVWALDWETYTQGDHKGDGFCLCDEDTCLWKPNLYEVLKLIISHVGQTGFCFNLAFDGSVILKMVKEEIVRGMRLDPKQRTVKLSFSGGRGKKKSRKFVIQWRGNKGMKIMEGHKVARLSDISPFYPGLGLNEASEIFLGETKEEIKGFEFDEESVEKRKDEIIKYCKQDARLTAKLGRLTQKRAEKWKIYTRDFPSPASLGERFINKRSKYIGRIHPNKPTKKHPCLDTMEFEGTYSNPIEYAWLAFGGSWFECVKRGFFPKLYRYDINSAFPAISKTLVNIDPWFGREWVFYKDKIPRGEFLKYGFIRAKVTIRKNVYLSPIPLRIYEGTPLIVYPTGKFIVYITLNEFDFINEHLGKAEMIDGFFFLIDEETPEAIYQPITELYKEKKRLKPLKDKDPIAKCDYNLVKLWLNAAGYGKFIQRLDYKFLTPEGDLITRWKCGNMFNPVWAAVITSEVRLQLARAILGHEKNIVMIAADGILTTERLDLPISDKLGEWTEEVLENVVVVRSGVYQARGKKAETKTRGFKAKFGTIKHPYTDLFKYFTKYPKITYIVSQYQRPLTVDECLLPTHKDYNFSRVCEFIKVCNRFHLEEDKREWDKQTLTGKELLSGVIFDSKPRNETGIKEAFDPEELGY